MVTARRDAAAKEGAAEVPKGGPALSGRKAARGAGENLDLTTEEGRERARVEIRKIAGDVGINFVDTSSDAGSYDVEGHVVTLAANHQGALGTAFHEALHAIFKAIAPNDKRELYKGLHTITTRTQLLKLLEGSPEAQNAVRSDPEELAAYAFQFWKLGMLDLNPVASHWFERLQQLTQRVWQWMRGQASAEQIFERVANGFYRDGADVAANAVLRAEGTRPRVHQVFNTVARAYERVWDTVCTTMDDRLRQTGISEINEIAQQLYTRVGERGEERGLAQIIPQRSKKFLNELGMILGRDPAVSIEALQSLAEERLATGGEARQIAEKIRGFLKRMHVYQREAGMDLGFVANYLPMQWSGDKIRNDTAGFVRMLESHKADIAKLNAEMRQKYGDAWIDMTPESITNMMGQRNLKHAIPTGDVYDSNGVPTDHHSVDRVFGFLTAKERAPWVEDNLLGTMTQYVKQSVKRAEYVRRFGEKSEKLNDLKARAKRSGATDAQIALVQDSIDNIYNVRHNKMDPQLRAVLGGAQFYQNIRVLGLSLLSSVVDPMALAVRSQEFGEAWGAYKAAVKGFLPKSRTELDQLAEDVGAIEVDGVMDSIVEMYGGYEMEGLVKKANDMLFTYNGMNGLTRSLRVYATGAAQRFIVKHHAANNERMLAELGLKKSDVRLVDGKLAYRGDQFKALGMDAAAATTAARKVQDAINRFVDESVLRPNAQERPNWGSDPLWGLVFHLKQYIFSFHKIINTKVLHEMTETGSSKPLLTAIPFIPIMAASTAARDLIQFGGDIPADRGFLQYLGSGFERSGLLGPLVLPLDLVRDGPAGVAGPTASQGLEFLEVLSPTGGKTLDKFVESSLPLSSIYKRW